MVQRISEAQNASNAATECVVVVGLGRIVRPGRWDGRMLPNLVIAAHPMDDGPAAEGLADQNDGRAGGDAGVVHFPCDGVGEDAEVAIERPLGADGASDLAVVAGALGDDDDAAQTAELRLEGSILGKDTACSGANDEDGLGTTGGS